MSQQWSFVVKVDAVRTSLPLHEIQANFERENPTEDGKIDYVFRFYFDGKCEDIAVTAEPSASGLSSQYVSSHTRAFTYNIMAASASELFQTLQERFVTCQVVQRVRKIHAEVPDDNSLITFSPPREEEVKGAGSNEVILTSASLPLLEMILSDTTHYVFRTGRLQHIRKEEADLLFDNTQDGKYFSVVEVSMEEKTYIDSVFKELHVFFEPDIDATNGQYAVSYGPQWQMAALMTATSRDGSPSDRYGLSPFKNSLLSSVNQSGRAFSITACNAPVSRTDWQATDTDHHLCFKNMFSPLVVHSTLTRFVQKFAIGILVEHQRDETESSRTDSPSSESSLMPMTQVGYFELGFETLGQLLEDVMDNVSLPFKCMQKDGGMICEGIINLLGLPCFRKKAVYLLAQAAQRTQVISGFENPFLKRQPETTQLTITAGDDTLVTSRGSDGTMETTNTDAEESDHRLGETSSCNGASGTLYPYTNEHTLPPGGFILDEGEKKDSPPRDDLVHTPKRESISIPSGMPTPPYVASPPPRRRSGETSPSPFSAYQSIEADPAFEKLLAAVGETPSILSQSDNKNVHRTLLTEDSFSVSESPVEAAFEPLGPRNLVVEEVEEIKLAEPTADEPSVLSIVAEGMCESPADDSTLPNQFKTDSPVSTVLVGTNFPSVASPLRLLVNHTPVREEAFRAKRKQDIKEATVEKAKRLNGPSWVVEPTPPTDDSATPFRRTAHIVEDKKSPLPKPKTEETFFDSPYSFSVAGLSPSPPQRTASSAHATAYRQLLKRRTVSSSVEGRTPSPSAEGHAYCVVEETTTQMDSSPVGPSRSSPPVSGFLPSLIFSRGASPSVRPPLAAVASAPARQAAQPDMRVLIVEDPVPSVRSKSRDVSIGRKVTVAELRWNAFMEAVLSGDVQLAQHLLFHDENLIRQNDQLLMKACVTKDVNADCLKFLLVTRPDFIRSMDVNTCCTPLHCVCAADYHTSLNAEAIKLLLVSGAAAGVRNKDGLTPLHLCILFPFQLLRTQSELLVDEDEVVSQATEAIDLLLMLGNADINERTSRHETPLHLISKQVPHTVNPKAVESIALKMVYFLSTRGADPSLKTPYNNKGTVAKLTPGEMAHHTGQLRVSAFLDGLVLQNE